MSTTPKVLPISVRSVDQMLDVEGSPLVGPRIHPDVASAIRSEASEHPRGSNYRIEIKVPAADVVRLPEVQTAIRAHFQRECTEAREELKSLREKGCWTFLVALGVVALLTVLSEGILKLGDARIFEILSESLVIVAWVTLWGPAETLLFSPFPFRRTRDLTQSLSTAEVALASQT